jgi:hypothetical protein
MVVPKAGRGAVSRPSGVVAPEVPLDGLVTELRVHGVGGTPPDALLDDLTPQQVGGDRVAGFYRTSDLESTSDGAAPGAPRHVEAYSWGGLTSRSGVRVLWLLLMPFMLANLAGWMYRGGDGDGLPRGARFACHRIASGLACLALTVNAALVTAMIAVDLLAYQAPRAGLAGRWWLWPLSWTWVRGHGERPLVIGFAAVLVVIGLLALLAVRTQGRYEAVRPPWRVADSATGSTAGRPAGSTKDLGQPPDRLRKSAADRGMADPDFWNSALAVRRMTGAHLGAALGFLAVTFALTARTAAGGPVRGTAWWWVAMVAGGASLAVAVLVVVADRWIDRFGTKAFGTKPLDGWPQRVVLHAVAPIGLVSAAVFAFQQPTMRADPGSLPGLDGIVAATYLALAGTIALMVLVGFAGVLSGASTGRGGLFGGPAVVMALAAGMLNSMLLGVLFVAGHALGPLRSDSRPGPGTINVPVAVGWAAPALGAALMVAVLVWVVTQAIRMLTQRGVPASLATDLDTYRETLPGSWPSTGDDRDWVVGMVAPPDGSDGPLLDGGSRRLAWRRRLARAYWFGDVRATIGPLLWLIAGLQAAVMIVIVAARPPIPDAGYGANGALGKTVILAATVVLVLLMWMLRTGWRNPRDRRRICILWDVGTFWPRSYHPLAPPSYAERAVPDLQRRIWRLNDHRAPTLVVAHSQGTVLAAAALLQPDCRARAGRIGLATFGSPLCKLYGWAFPGYLSAQVLSTIGAPDRPDQAKVLRWHNFSYPTDPIGGPVTDGRQPECPLPKDIRLLDPDRAWRIYDDPAPAPGGHSGYWTDVRVWQDIDAMADELRKP